MNEQRDPYTEPENSTVHDWMGQEVNEDQELVDELVEETGGDMQEAERRFEDQSAKNRQLDNEVERPS